MTSLIAARTVSTSAFPFSSFLNWPFLAVPVSPIGSSITSMLLASRRLHIQPWMHPLVNPSCPALKRITVASRDPEVWRSRIGMELHVRLARTNKLFSRCKGRPDAPSNFCSAPFDAALPGAQPALSSETLGLAILAGLALRCRFRKRSRFDRKHYIYSDLPNGYQITQHFSAFADSGIVTIPTHRKGMSTLDVRIKQVQLEQDTAKTLEDPAADASVLVDLNRSGVGLIEIVTEPDMVTAQQAVSFVRQVRSLLRHAGVSDGNMEEGSLRCDLNVSVRLPEGIESERCEIKNVNGFGNIEAAIQSEITRHIQMLKLGQRGTKETRGFDVRRSETFKLRSKETTPDYRLWPSLSTDRSCIFAS